MESVRIRRPINGGNINPSRTYGAAAAIHTPLGAHATDPEQFAKASGTSFLGFTHRAMTADGPVLADHVFADTRLELPYKVGDAISLIDAAEIDVPSHMCLTSGTGALDGTEENDVKISFDADGKFYEAQSGDIVFFMVAGQLAAVDDDEDFRLVLVRV